MGHVAKYIDAHQDLGPRPEAFKEVGFRARRHDQHRPRASWDVLQKGIDRLDRRLRRDFVERCRLTSAEQQLGETREGGQAPRAGGFTPRTLFSQKWKLVCVKSGPTHHGRVQISHFTNPVLRRHEEAPVG